MAWVGEKGGSRLHRGQMTAFALDTEILLDATLLGHQAHQCLRLMGVELIRDEDPARLRVCLDGLADVSGEVGFGACGSNARCHDLPGSHLQIGDQTLRAMPLVFEFLALDMPRQQRQGRMETREGLDAGHLIGTEDVCPLRSKRGSGFIHLTDGADLFGQLGGVVGRRSEPVALAMRL